MEFLHHSRLLQFCLRNFGSAQFMIRHQSDDYHRRLCYSEIDAALGRNLINVYAFHFRRRIIKPNQRIIKSNSNCLLQHFMPFISRFYLNSMHSFSQCNLQLSIGKWRVHNDAIFTECGIWCNEIISPLGPNSGI